MNIILVSFYDRFFTTFIKYGAFPILSISAAIINSIFFLFLCLNRERSDQPQWTSQRNPRRPKKRSERTPMSPWSQCQPMPCSSGTRRPTSKPRTPTPPLGRCQRSWPPCGMVWGKNRNRYIPKTVHGSNCGDISLISDHGFMLRCFNGVMRRASFKVTQETLPDWWQQFF